MVTAKHGLLVVMIGIVVMAGVVMMSPAAAQDNTNNNNDDGNVSDMEMLTDDVEITVDVEPDGDASITIWYRFDLSVDEEQAAFSEIQADEELQGNLTDEIHEWLSSVAEDTSAKTDRDMEIGSPYFVIEEIDGSGIVSFNAPWSNLAAVDEDEIDVIVTEPFASGFVDSYDFELVAMSDSWHGFKSVTPEPLMEGSVNSLTWEDGTDFSEFEVVVSFGEPVPDNTSTPMPTATPPDTDDDSGSPIPGFTALIAVTALAITLLTAQRYAS